MNPVLDPPKPVRSRRIVAGLWNDPDTRSVTIGILGVLLVHLIVLLTAPRFLPSGHLASARRQAIPRQFNIQIAPNAFIKQPPKPPPTKFVETNPNAPENIPDKTNNFAARNQQVAQEKPQEEDHNDHPKIDGRKDVHSTQIVTGQLQNQVDRPVPITPPAPVQQKTQANPRQLQNPLTGFEKKQGDSTDGFGSNLAKLPDNAKPIPERIDGSKQPTHDGSSNSSAVAIDPMHPRPRPALQVMKVRPAIFEDNKIGTRNVGLVGVDAKFSNYGAYLQRMVEAVQAQWDRILIESATNPPPGTHVVVTFRLDDKGTVTQILQHESTSSEQGTDTCVSAITSRSPYGEWTDDMKAVLGKSQDLTYTFYFE